MFKKIIYLIFVIIFLNSIDIFAAPSIVILTDNRADYTGSQIPKYEKYELTFTLDSTYSNPYNYDTSTGGVIIDAYFTHQGSGFTDTVGAFWFQDYTRTKTTNNYESLAVNGSPCWKVRYTPDTTGTFDYSIKLVDSTGQYTLIDSTAAFVVVDSSNKGFIRVNPKNNSYFAYDNGDDFFGIGVNAEWWPGDRRLMTLLFPSESYHKSYFYDKFFNTMKQNKANLARVFMINAQNMASDWVLSIQKGTGNIGKNYDLTDAWRLDQMLSAAKDNGIYIQLILEVMDTFGYHWEESVVGLNDGNIYNTSYSGYLSKRSEFFTNGKAKDSWKQLLRYLVSRYGYSPNIHSWEIFNEINELRWSYTTTETWDWNVIKNWHSEMGQEIDGLDVNKHLITVSTGNTASFPDLYSLPEIDYGQMHVYYLKNYYVYSPSDFFELISFYSEKLLKDTPTQPHIFSEFGNTPYGQTVTETWYYYNYGSAVPSNVDTAGISIHNAIWTGVLSGLSATPLFWSSGMDVYYAYPSWLKQYKYLANYIDGESLSDSTLVTINSEKANIISNPGFENDTTYWNKNPISSIKFSIDTTNPHGGAKCLKWQSDSAQTLAIYNNVYVMPNQDYNFSGWIKTQSVVGSSNGIIIALNVNNGSTTLGINVTPYYTDTRDWTYFSLNLTTPPSTGPSRYTADVRMAFYGDTGTAWFDDFILTPIGDFASPSINNSNIRMIAKKNNSKVLGWVQNINHTWQNIGILRGAVVAETGTITIPNMVNTTYSAEWWDTYSTAGTLYRKQKAKVTDGTLNLFLPIPLTTDIAVKVKPLTDTTSSVLDWTGEIGYTNDGVNPESGYSNTTIFTFRVKYTDPGNYFPTYMHLLLDKNGDGDYTDSGEIINMDEDDTNDNNVTDGKIYTKAVTIPFSPGFSNISYKFEISDGIYLASGIPATAINSPDLILDLSLTISSAEINLNKLNLASFSQPASITLNNTTNEGFEAFTLQITGAGADWVPGSASADNTYVLKALFTGVSDTPVAGDFNDDDIVTNVNKTATSTNFGDSKFSANGASVPAGSAVKLWLLFKTPKSSNSQTEQNISLTIGIIDAN